MTVFGARWTVFGARWTVFGARWTVFGARWTVFGARWTVPAGGGPCSARGRRRRFPINSIDLVMSIE